MLGPARRHQHARPARRQPLRPRPRLRSHRALAAALRVDLRGEVSAYISSGTRPRRSSAIALLIAAAVLYFAKEVLIPVAMAILLSFLLAPAVLRLEQGKRGPPPSRLTPAPLALRPGFARDALHPTPAPPLRPHPT